MRPSISSVGGPESSGGSRLFAGDPIVWNHFSNPAGVISVTREPLST